MITFPRFPVQFFPSTWFALIFPICLLFSCGGDDSSSSAGAAPGPSLKITWPDFPDAGTFEGSSGFLRDPVIDP